MTIPDFVPAELAQLDITLSDQQLHTLAAYLDHLLETNRTMNLTAVREPEAAWRKLIIDSLTALPGLSDLPADARVIEVGSGGGLPGVPLAVARPDVNFTLLEATGKKARFLEGCVTKLELSNVSIVTARAEDAGQDAAHRQAYDLAVCRALGPMRVLLELTLPFVRVGGALLAMKGPTVEAELTDAGDALAALGGGEVHVFDAYPAAADINTVIVHVTKANPTPRKYPRKPGVPKQSPL